ncbi:MAG: hypothetical protein O7G88_20200, partial [bacterium]|nr:hypothetical protein [bacterium]
TEEEAKRLSASRNLAKLKTALGRREGVPPVEDALAYPYSVDESAYVRQFSQYYIDGDPQQVKQGLDSISQTYQTCDLSVVTICYDFDARVRSYELIAEVCGLKEQCQEKLSFDTLE